MPNNTLKRLLDFITLIMLNQHTARQVPALAHKHLFQEEEQDTAVYAYGPYDDLEHHQEQVLVVKFINDDGLKVFVAWQGVSVTVESNLPGMGWDQEDGASGLGGDWWKRR